MKKTVKILACVLALVLLCLSGCGSEKQVSQEDLEALLNQASRQEEPAVEEPAAEEPEEPEEAAAEEPEEPAFEPKGKVEIEVDALPKEWTLTELGAAEDGQGTLTVRSDDLLVRYERDGDNKVRYYPVDHMGKTLSDQVFDDVEELLPEVYTVRAIQEGVNNTGLLLEDGEQLLDCEAAIIRCVYSTYTEQSERYLLVVYGTEETENEDEAFFYATESWFSIQPEEGDVFYKGYGKVYDLELRRFVPELTINNADKYALHAGGSLLSYEDEEGVTRLYNADGKELYKVEGYASLDLGDSFAVVDYSTVLDEQGEVLLKSEDYWNVLDGTGRFLVSNGYGDQKTKVMDYFGNLLFELPGDHRVNRDGGGYFCGSIGEDGALFDKDGNIVVQVEGISSPSYEGYGIWEFYSLDSEVKTVYYLANGTTVEADGRSAYELINELAEPPEGEQGILPWNAPEEPVTVPGSYPDRLTSALTLIGDREKTLIDCFGGNILLTGKSIEFANSRYIYVETDGGLTVYELQPAY